MTVDTKQQFGNLLKNSSFESWSGGVTTDPDEWESGRLAANYPSRSTTAKIHSYSAAIKWNGVTAPNGFIRNKSSVTGNWLSHLKGRTVSAGVWVKTGAAAKAWIAINDGVGETLSSKNTGTGWEFLTATRTIDALATAIYLIVYTDDATNDTLVDGAILVEGCLAPAFMPDSGENYLPFILRNTGGSPDDVEWVWKYLNNTYTQGEPCLVLRSNKNVLGNDLRVVITRYGNMAIWPVEGSDASPIPKSPYDPGKINALTIDGDVVFGDHLVHAKTQILNLKRLPLALPHGTLNTTLNAGVTSVPVTTGGRVGLPAPGHATYRAAIWDTTQGYGTDGNPDAAEIIKVTSTVDNGDGTFTLTIIRGQDNTSDVQHTVGTGKTPRITKLLDISPTGDLAITNLLSGETRGSGRIFGGAGIGIVPLTGSSEEDGYITIDAYGRGNTGNANCIVFRTTSAKAIANPAVTERARITSDGSIEHFVDSTKDSLVHRRYRRFNDITNASWTTVATISPSTVTNVHRRGYVKAIVSAQRDTVTGGHLRISQWYFDYAGAAPTMFPIVIDTTSGTAGSIPNFQLVASGNNVLAQVQGGGVNNSDGSIMLEIFCPYDNSGATWTVS